MICIHLSDLIHKAIYLSRNRWSFPMTDLSPLSSAVVALWSTQTIVSHGHCLNFSDAKNHYQVGKKLTTWWSWTNNPQNFCNLRAGNVHHPVNLNTNRSENHASVDHIPWTPFLTLPLKMLCRNPSGILGFFGAWATHSPCMVLK